MRSRFAILLAVAVVCVTTAWAGWTSESLVTGSEGVVRYLIGNNGHKVVFGTDGVGHLVWHGGPSDNLYTGVWYNRYNPGSGSRPGYWGADFGIAPKGKRENVGRGDPCIALDGDGRTIHVVWMSDPAGSAEPESVCYRMCTQDKKGNDKWGTTLHLYATSYLFRPVVACAPNEPNHVFVCWRYLVEHQPSGWSMVTKFREYVNGAWTAVVRLDSSYMSPQDFASIAAAPNGDVFVAYCGYDVGTSDKQIFVKTRHNGVWGQPVNVTKSFSSLLCRLYTIEVNPITGNPHLVFDRVWVVPNGASQDTFRAVCHTYRNSQGTWLPTPELISVPFHVHGYGVPLTWPTMAFLSNGAAYVAWRDTVPPASCGNMCSYCSSEGGTWSTPEWLTSYSSPGPFLAVDEASSAVRVVWSRYGDVGDEIWWKSNYLGDGDGGGAQPTAISQSRIELFPNPAKAGRVTVQYALPHAGPMTVTLLDVSGRAVRTQEFAASDRGSAALDVRGLNAGVYVMRIESGTTSQTRKLVIE